VGRDIDEVRFTREDRQRYREKVKRDLDVLRQMLEGGSFETQRKLIGVEVEFYVVDTDGEPMMINAELLSRIESEDFQTELAQFNIEFNLAPTSSAARSSARSRRSSRPPSSTRTGERRTSTHTWS
jgi:hypothetical protein